MYVFRNLQMINIFLEKLNVDSGGQDADKIYAYINAYFKNITIKDLISRLFTKA